MSEGRIVDLIFAFILGALFILAVAFVSALVGFTVLSICQTVGRWLLCP